MSSPFERYEQDLKRLVEVGGKLTLRMQYDMKQNSKKPAAKKSDEEGGYPDVRSKYESWYSESLSLIKQILPERVEDFRAYYSPKINRKEILYSNYTMSDYLRGTTITRQGDVVVGPDAALPALYQQFNMIQGLQNNLKSSLLNIRTMVSADLFDSELDAAYELNTNGYQRGAGAIAGVVLEGHLVSVADRHSCTPKEKNLSISDLNDTLKNDGDIRNKCDHKKTSEPTKAEVTDLIEGIRKITKTVF